MLLIVAQHTNPNHISTGYYWEKIISNLSKNHQILLVTEDACLSLEKNEKIKLLPVKVPKFFEDNFNFGIGLFKKIYISIVMIIKAIKNAKHVESIFVGTNPFLIVLLPIFLKILFIKTKVHILIFDLFPHNLIASSNNFLVKIILNSFKYLFNFSYKKAFKVFSIGKDMSKILQDNKINKNNIIYTPNWCDDTYEFNKDKKKDALLSLGINYEEKKNIIVLYFGNLGLFQEIEFFLNIISNTKNKDLIFLFVGEGPKKNQIMHAAKFDERIQFRNGVPISQRSSILNCGDISLTILSDKMYGLAVPSKSYFSLAHGLPLLTIMNKKSEISNFVNKNNFGWIFSLKEKKEIVTFLDSISVEAINDKKNQILLKQEKYRSHESLKKINKIFSKGIS